MKNVMAVCRFEIIHCLFLLLEFMCSSLSSLPAPHFTLICETEWGSVGFHRGMEALLSPISYM